MIDLPKLPGSENMSPEQRAALCNEFIARAIIFCKQARVPVEVIEHQLLATAAASHAIREGSEATAKWLQTAAEKVALHKPPAGNA